MLCPVPRAGYRDGLRPSNGYDVWNCYELSWLREDGPPGIAVARITVPSDSTAIVESKSLKLYLGSFSGTVFASGEGVREVVLRDLTRLLGTDSIGVELFAPSAWPLACALSAPRGTCIDGLPVPCRVFDKSPDLLSSSAEAASEVLHSNLLRTLCPVTGQPDWATVEIVYSGRRISHEGLLQYLVSYRNSTGFHEHCCETIFSDIAERCGPDALTVRCFFTRRGGIDINPVRTTRGNGVEPESTRLPRQ